MWNEPMFWLFVAGPVAIGIAIGFFISRLF
jgi:hypothetical protein